MSQIHIPENVRRCDIFRWNGFGLTLFVAANLNIAQARAQDLLPSGDAVIRAPAGESEIVITTTSRLAGAIHSLTWNGREFIDSADHGRQLQSASNLDAGRPIAAESFNPTEAGSRRDGAGDHSSSRLLHLVATDRELQTTTQMAFWLAPDEESNSQPARNTTVLSNHLLTKRVRIGCDDLPHVIPYDVTFSIPVGERHTHAVFEAATGYMPDEFETFWRLRGDSEELAPLSDGPGEQADPVVFSTTSGSHAMGVYSPDQPSTGWEHIGYGRFRFPEAGVVKWNCVFRTGNGRDPIECRDYAFRVFVVVGDLTTVQRNMVELRRRCARDAAR